MVTEDTDKSRILVYIHANFGERKENNYAFESKDSKEYKRLIQTDDWNDIGSLYEFRHFFHTWNNESIIL